MHCACIFFLVTNQGILLWEFMSLQPELCSACDSVQYFWRILCCVGASLLNSTHCLSCYSFHYQCSWCILYTGLKKKQQVHFAIFKTAALSVFLGVFGVICRVVSFSVLLLLFLFFYILMMCILMNPDIYICLLFTLSFVSQ